MTRPGKPPVNAAMHEEVKGGLQQVWQGWFNNLAAQFSNTNLQTFPTVGASPATYTNTGTSLQQVLITGGTVSQITFGRKNAAGTFVNTIFATSTPAQIILSSGDRIIITYTSIPVVTVSPL
jgi:hypothetical protein